MTQGIDDFMEVRGKFMHSKVEWNYQLFSERCILFKSLKFPDSEYSKYCRIKKYSSGEIILAEGDTSEIISFI